MLPLICNRHINETSIVRLIHRSNYFYKLKDK